LNNKVVDTLNSIKLMLEKLPVDYVDDDSIFDLKDRIQDRIEDIEYRFDKIESDISKIDDYNYSTSCEVKSLKNQLDELKSSVCSDILGIDNEVAVLSESILKFNEQVNLLVEQEVHRAMITAVSNLDISIKYKF
jgi:hypothetical protein